MGAVDVVVALVAVKEVCFNRAATSNGGGAGAVDFAAFAVGHDAGGDLLVGGALVVEVAGVFVNFIQKCVAGGDLAELAGGVSPFHEEGAAWILLFEGVVGGEFVEQGGMSRTPGSNLATVQVRARSLTGWVTIMESMPRSMT